MHTSGSNPLTIISQTKIKQSIDGLVGFFVFKATFNNIWVISWRSVLLVNETEVPGENHWPAASQL